MSLQETDPIILALIIILGLIAIVQGLILFFGIRNAPYRASNRITEAMDEAIQRLGEATQHHVEVNAVLALLDTFKERPSLVERLGEYADQVVAAAILTRINATATDIKNVTAEQTRLEKDIARNAIDVRPNTVKRNREKLATLQGELEAMHRLAQHFEAIVPVPT